MFSDDSFAEMPSISASAPVIVVTQGTVETDVNKLLVPALEAFKNSEVLVIATTGGTGTEEEECQTNGDETER